MRLEQSENKPQSKTKPISLAALLKVLMLLSCVGMRDIGSKPDLNTAKNALDTDIRGFRKTFERFNTTFNQAKTALTNPPTRNKTDPDSLEFLGRLTGRYYNLFYNPFYNYINNSTLGHWQHTRTQLPEKEELRRQAFLTALAVQGNRDIPDLLKFAEEHWSKFRTSADGNTEQTAQNTALQMVRKVTGDRDADPFEVSIILGHPILSLREGPPRWQDVFLMLMLKDINPKQMQDFLTRKLKNEQTLSQTLPTPQTPQNYAPKFVKAWEALPSEYRLKNFHDILEKVIATTSSKDEFSPNILEKLDILLDIAKKHTKKEYTLLFQLSQITKKIHQLSMQTQYQFAPALMEQLLKLLVGIDSLIVSKRNAAVISNYKRI